MSFFPHFIHRFGRVLKGRELQLTKRNRSCVKGSTDKESQKNRKSIKNHLETYKTQKVKIYWKHTFSLTAPLFPCLSCNQFFTGTAWLLSQERIRHARAAETNSQTTTRQKRRVPNITEQSQAKSSFQEKNRKNPTNQPTNQPTKANKTLVK